MLLLCCPRLASAAHGLCCAHEGQQQGEAGLVGRLRNGRRGQSCGSPAQKRQQAAAVLHGLWKSCGRAERQDLVLVQLMLLQSGGVSGQHGPGMRKAGAGLRFAAAAAAAAVECSRGYARHGWSAGGLPDASPAHAHARAGEEDTHTHTRTHTHTHTYTPTPAPTHSTPTHTNPHTHTCALSRSTSLCSSAGSVGRSADSSLLLKPGAGCPDA
eukprot:503401-Pelagomonas_calceolata.AAC.3